MLRLLANWRKRLHKYCSPLHRCLPSPSLRLHGTGSPALWMLEAALNPSGLRLVLPCPASRSTDWSFITRASSRLHDSVELLRSPRAIVFYLVVERMPIVPDKLTLLSREPGPDDHVGCIEQIDELCTLCGVVSRKPSGRIGRFSLYQTRHTTFMRMESDDGQWRKSGSTLDATTPSGGGK
ncbi:hypothetical protein BC628DRAFT_1082032 [Trametes gibbosa]|nr:hypothetical protein BC628DRAFT_1082032 [Trametes gibbosa]